MDYQNKINPNNEPVDYCQEYFGVSAKEVEQDEKTVIEGDVMEWKNEKQERDRQWIRTQYVNVTR